MNIRKIVLHNYIFYLLFLLLSYIPYMLWEIAITIKEVTSDLIYCIQYKKYLQLEKMKPKSTPREYKVIEGDADYCKKVLNDWGKDYNITIVQAIKRKDTITIVLIRSKKST